MPYTQELKRDVTRQHYSAFLVVLKFTSINFALTCKSSHAKDTASVEVATARTAKTDERGLGTTAQAEHQVEGRLLLDVVVGQRAAVLQLLAGKDQALLVGGDALLVLDLGLDVVDRVRRLHLERDGLAGQRLHEDLHATAQAEHQVERRLLLDVVVRQGAAGLELLAGKDQALLVGGDALLVLDLRLNVVNR